MISISHMKTLSKSKSTDVWCSDSLREHLMRFDRLSLCSQIKAIPIEDVVDMLKELQLEIEKLSTLPEYQDEDYFLFGTQKCNEIIQQKINVLKEESEE